MKDDQQTVTNGDVLTHDERTLRQMVHDLGERVKELNCLYGISSLVERPGISLQEIIQGTVELLPAAWQYPQVACARITLEGQEFRSQRFQETVWRQAADIVVHGQRVGTVEVCYREARPERDGALESGGPFLKEERKLLDAVAERLGRAVERVRAESQRDAAQEALRERERQLYLIADNIPAVIVYVDADKRYRFANQTHAQLLGRSREEMIGKPFREILGDKVYAVLRDKVETVLSGRRVTFEALLPTPSGEELWFDMSYVPDIDERGTVRGYVVLGNDVTERVQAQEALQRAHDELEQRVAERTAELAQANANLRAEITARMWAEAALQEAHDELERRVADRTRELAVLYEVAALASRSPDLETTLAGSLERVLGAMHGGAGLIHLLGQGDGTLDDGAGESLRLVVQRGLPPDLAAAIASLPADEGLGGWVVEHDEPLILPDITSDPRMTLTSPVEPRAYVGIPLRAGGRTLGVLSIVRGTGEPPLNVEELSLLTSVGDQLGIAVESARLRQRAERAAVSEERGRLARALHDSVTQLLYSVNLFARAGKDAYSQGNVEQGSGYLTRLGDTASQAMKEMRLLLYELRPQVLEREGLIAAIRHRLDAVERRAGVEASLVDETSVELAPEVEGELYYIVQEALNNALKHSRAASVQVCIKADREGIGLSITDDGSGFDPYSIADNGGLGLASMGERAQKLGGTLTVVSEPGKGTTVRFSWEEGVGSKK